MRSHARLACGGFVPSRQCGRHLDSCKAANGVALYPRDDRKNKDHQHDCSCVVQCRFERTSPKIRFTYGWLCGKLSEMTELLVL